MFLMRFTERAYVNYTEQDVRNSPNEAVRLTFSNSTLTRRKGPTCTICTSMSTSTPRKWASMG